MPKIIRGKERTRGTPGGISAGNVGSAAINAGRQLQDIGNAYVAQATQSIRASTYNKISSRATDELLQEIATRKDQRTDKDGNPTFDTLTDDVRGITDKVKDKYSANIFDAEIAAKFESEFGHFARNQQIIAQKEARKQHLDFGTATLNERLDTLKKQSASDDPSNAELYLDQGADALDEALANGLISATQHQKSSDAFDTDVKVNHLRNSITANPEGALEVLNNRKAADLDIPEQVRDQLIREAEAGAKDIKREQARSFAEAEAEVKQAQQINYERTLTDIEMGTSSFKQIEQDKERLGEIYYNRAKRQMSKQVKQNTSKAVINDSIMKDVKGGKVLVGTYTQSDIDKSIKAQVNARTNPDTGVGPSRVEVAKIAVEYKAPSTAVSRDLDFVLKYEDGESLSEALDSFAYLTTPDGSRSHVLKSGAFTQEARRVGAAIESYMDNANLPMDKAASIVRENILNVTEEVKQARATNYRGALKLSAGKDASKKMKTIARDIAGDFSAFGVGKASVSDNVVPILDRMIRDEFLATGDMDASIKSVSKLLGGTLAHTQIADADREKVMFNPPEVFLPNTDPKIIRQSLNNDLAGVIPSNVSPDRIVFESDVQTIDKNQPGIISYNLHYITDDGEMQFLTYPLGHPNEGQAVRWVLDPESVGKAGAQSVIEAQRAKRLGRGGS